MANNERPVFEGRRAPKAEGSRVSLGLAVALIVVGSVAIVSWFLGPNALGQESSGHTERDNAFLFMIAGPVAIPAGLYFLYLWRKERSTLAAYQVAHVVNGTVTHLWKEGRESANRKYRVGYVAPGARPAFVCVDVRTYKSLSVGDTVRVRVVGSDAYIEL